MVNLYLKRGPPPFQEMPPGKSAQCTTYAPFSHTAHLFGFGEFFGSVGTWLHDSLLIFSVGVLPPPLTSLLFAWIIKGALRSGCFSTGSAAFAAFHCSFQRLARFGLPLFFHL